VHVGNCEHADFLEYDSDWNDFGVHWYVLGCVYYVFGSRKSGKWNYGNRNKLN
jgi:hypothetical protein